MNELGERLIYAALSGLFGALLGLLCWWLYGMAYSWTYMGPGLDPVLRHWLLGMGGGFATLGLIFGARVADWLGDTLSVIIHIEQFFFHPPSRYFLLALLTLGALVTVLWLSAPGR